MKAGWSASPGTRVSSTAGTIEKTWPPTEVRVPEDILSRGKAAYDDCVAELSALCTTVPA